MGPIALSVLPAQKSDAPRLHQIRGDGLLLLQLVPSASELQFEAENFEHSSVPGRGGRFPKALTLPGLNS